MDTCTESRVDRGRDELSVGHRYRYILQIQVPLWPYMFTGCLVAEASLSVFYQRVARRGNILFHMPISGYIYILVALRGNILIISSPFQIQIRLSMMT